MATSSTTWRKGQSGNPRGRIRKEIEREYASILYRSVSREDWASILDKAVEQAREGDAVARRWLSDLLGFRREANPYEEVGDDDDDQPATT